MIGLRVARGGDLHQRPALPAAPVIVEHPDRRLRYGLKAVLDFWGVSSVAVAPRNLEQAAAVPDVLVVVIAQHSATRAALAALRRRNPRLKFVVICGRPWTAGQLPGIRALIFRGKRGIHSDVLARSVRQLLAEAS